MRVAALAPVAALLVAAANAAPVPAADPFFCFFGWGPGCDSTPSITSVAAAKATSSSVVASSIKVTSTSAVATSSAKATSSSASTSTKSSSVASTSTKAATTTQAVANWTWLWEPSYVFNMWNNFLTFRWERYNDCSFNGYSLTYVKAYYYNTYGFKPLTGCQWKDVYSFLDKYAVKTSVKPASNAVYTPGCANPFGGADFGFKPTSSVAPTSSAQATSSAKASSASPAAVTSKAASSSVASSSVAASANASSASVPAASSPAASSPAASSQASSSSAASASQASASVAASSSAMQSSSAVVSSDPASATGGSSVASASGSSPSATGSDSASGTATASASVATATSYGSSVTFSNGQTAQYFGCVAEIDGRKFTKAGIDNPSAMTNEYCSSYCSNLGFPVSGSEYAKECYCATYDQIATYTTSDQCVMPCSADPTGQSICGGPQALSVYVNPSAVRTVSLPTSWAVQGCYQDNYDRVLTTLAWSGNTATTVESCSAQCAASGYNIAGVEYGTECYCGNSFVGGPVAIDSSSCSMPCPGDLSATCGGSWALTVASLTGAF